MVILLDLNEHAADPALQARQPGVQPIYQELTNGTLTPSQDDSPNTNTDSFFAALSCYPIVSQIVCHLDLNSIHDLAATCRRSRAELLQNRSQLIKHTLHCINEDMTIGPRLADRMREYQQARHRGGLQAWSGTMTGGRVSRCARDMVGECRRCGRVVCRNCTIKSPPPKAFTERHRRLCRTCIKVPLRYHTSDNELFDGGSADIFTHEAFSRHPCSCADMVWLCLSCGNATRGVDTTYMRCWTWRTRYSTYLGGLGTGIGEGNEGVECGRGDRCLMAKEVEKEIDCNADELADLKRDIQKVESEGRQWGGTSYMTQEMEGIGGVVKKKVKKRVRVGSVVKEYEDERESGDYLGRERKGLNRSWCFWCLRVIPGQRDSDYFNTELDSERSGGSSSSSVRSHE